MAHEPFDATPFLPERRTLDALRDAAGDCRGCDLTPVVIATIHPSSILRGRDGEAREAQRTMLIEDLRVAAQTLDRAR